MRNMHEACTVSSWSFRPGLCVLSGWWHILHHTQNGVHPGHQGNLDLQRMACMSHKHPANSRVLLCHAVPQNTTKTYKDCIFVTMSFHEHTTGTRRHHFAVSLSCCPFSTGVFWDYTHCKAQSNSIQLHTHATHATHVPRARQTPTSCRCHLPVRNWSHRASSQSGTGQRIWTKGREDGSPSWTLTFMCTLTHHVCKQTQLGIIGCLSHECHSGVWRFH